MNLFDVKWEEKLRELGLEILLNSRYVDDGRTFLHPVACGWRWEEGDLIFCRKWEEEDNNLSLKTITKHVILGTLNEVEPFLRFIIESQEDFPTGWLPTLDTCLRVNDKNQIVL